MSQPAHPRVVVVGSTMMDLIAYMKVMPSAGETVTGEQFELGFGGKGANQAVMLARLGADVIFVNCVGGDIFGTQTIEHLHDVGLDTTRVRPIPGAATGVAPIWVTPDGTNRIVIVPGANLALDASTVRAALEGIDDVACVVCQLEIPLEAVREAFTLGRSWGSVNVLNPAPAAGPLDATLLGLVDWLVPNESEFRSLFGAEFSVGTSPSLLPARPNIVVTLGEAGAAIVSDASATLVAAPAVTAVDSTGAGDAFVAGFSYYLARGFGAAEAVTVANVCGALSVTRRGTQTSFPDRDEVSRLLESTGGPADVGGGAYTLNR